MCARTLLLCPVLLIVLRAQEVNSPDPLVRGHAAQELGKQGSEAIPQLATLLNDPVVEVRVDAVKSLVAIGTQRSLDPLVAATRDNDPEVQIRATDGLVNFYLPGYAQTGLTASLKRVGTAIKSRWIDTNDQVIPARITPRQDIVEALGRLARGGASMESRANAARGAGVLRGSLAVPDLIEALRTKDDRVLYEVLIALQKIRDPSAAPRITFLLRDFSEKIQIAAIETTGLLQNRDALPALRTALNRAESKKVKRAALTAIAMLADAANRPVYERYFQDKDEGLRAAAGEGYGRLKDAADADAIRKAFESEGETAPRLAFAFAVVSLGDATISEFSALQYLVNTLNSRAYSGVAEAYLIELAREPAVRGALYPVLGSGSKHERMKLAAVLGRSGDRETVAHLESLAKDADPLLAAEGLRALQHLRTRLL